MFEPTAKNFWRGIVLYGSNQSTYKIGLAERLLDYANRNITKVPLDEFGDDWLTAYLSRTKNGKPQSRRRLVNGIEKGLTYTEQQIESYKQGKTTREKAIGVIIDRSLDKMVLQKFHTLFKRKIPETFFELSDNKSHLIIHDNLLDLAADKRINDLKNEVVGRWDLLEYGFSKPDNEESLMVDSDSYNTNHGRDAYVEIIVKNKRRNLTPLIPILNGYQQGKCFYCNDELFDIHVDHVIPHKAVQHDAICHLVLAHEHCNEGKHDFRPPKRFVQKLIDRNESVLKSDLPLKEELKKVLGVSIQERSQKVWKEYSLVKDHPLWGGTEKFNPANDQLYRQLLRSLNTSFWDRHLGNLQ